MDNLSHALIGVLIGRIAAPYVGSVRGAIIAAIAASNLPDIDLLWMPLFAERKLGYLMHHRGHSHTLIMVPLQALLLSWPLKRWMPELKFWPTFMLCVAGLSLHIGADSWNNYGVHPFWPFNNDWLYGDTIFIVEPWLWAGLGAFAWGEASRFWRGGLGLAGLTGLGAMFWILGPIWAGIWGLLSVGLAWYLPKISVGMRNLVGLLWMALVLVVFHSGSRAARMQVEALLDQQVPEERLIEVSRTPRPATPWCWQFIVTTEAPGGHHVLRSGLLSLMPAWTAAEDCGLRMRNDRSIGLRPPDLSTAPGIAWEGFWTRPISELQEYRQGSLGCSVDNYLHFGRAVWWQPEGDILKIGDLRYDFEKEEGFSELSLSTSTPCMTSPPWSSLAAQSLMRPAVGGRTGGNRGAQ